MSWSVATLGDVVERDGGLIQTGPFGSQLHQSDYVAEGIPVIMPKDISDGRVDADSVARVSEQTAHRLSRHQLRPRTIVLPRRGEITKRAFIREDQTGWLCGTGCLQIALEGKHLLPEFLYYYMEQHEVARWLEQHAVGTTMLNLSTGIVTELPLKYPAPAVQRRIADILSAYDDLIENNRRRMALLEAAARQLYREWFVRLRFPGHEHTRIINGVPEGWERKRFGEVLDHHIGGGWGQEESQGSETEEGYVIRGTDIPAVEAGNFGAVGLRYHDPRRLPQRILQAGDIIFEVSGGSATQTIGRTLLVTEEVLRALAPRVICASFCKLFRVADPILPSYLIRFLRHIRESGELSVFQKQSASALQNFQYQAFLEEQQVILPRRVLLKEFCGTESTLLRQQQTLAIQNHKLRTARDLLLPRLMSGQVAV